VAEPTKAQPVTPTQLQPPLPPSQTRPLQLPPLLPTPQIPPLQPALGPGPSTPDNNFFPPYKAIQIKRFRFIGNKVFSTKQLEKITAPYVGRNFTSADLSQARAAVNNLYVKAGYINSGAIFPLAANQGIDPNGAVVTIQVIEGTIEAINISGGGNLKRYVQPRLQAATSPVFNYNQLFEALRLLQTDPLVKSISATVNSGSEQDKLILDVQLKATQPLKVEIGADNYRSPAAGSFERFVQFSNANLLGLGDSLGATYWNTAGSNALAATYKVPIDVRNGTVSFAYNFQKNNVIEKPFNLLDINTDYRSYELSVLQPLIRKATKNSTQEFAVGLSAFHSDSQANLLGAPSRVSLGADEEGRTHLSAFRFFQEWRKQSNIQAVAIRSQLSLGLGLGATNNPTPPDSQFFSWLGLVNFTQVLPNNMRFVTSAGVQLADRPLLPSEQFVLGGQGTIRGYRNQGLLSDNGVFASLELQYPLYSNRVGKFLVIPFVDIGQGWNGGETAQSSPLASQTLASIGLGLQYELNDRLSARLNFGLPLINLPGENQSLQERGITFGVQGRLY